MAKHKLKKKFILPVFIFLALGSGIVALEKTNTINLFSKNKQMQPENEKTTSTTVTAQSEFTGADVRQPGNTLDENKGTAIITDSNGNIGNITDTSNPTVSKSGEITLYTPKQNSFLTKEVQVSGISSLKKVSYRLIDDISGVISMGELNVVSGKFSGTLSFQTNAAQGRLDFYGARDDGSEFSNIEVPVRFK